jgi:pimeloyl-ACP methyl ester carboxylesterase
MGPSGQEDVMTTVATAEMTTGSVISKDGTRIGYLRVGQGPAVVLLHGSNESARSHTQLALALADAFTVYLPDRRGRGLSGPHRPDHGIRTEVEDLQAVLTGSGAHKVFGVSVSGLIALEAARIQPAIRQIAAYEPALLMDTTRYTDWVTRFDREMAQGKVAAALITSMYGLDLAPPAFKLMGRRLAEALTDAAMKREDKTATSDTVTERELAPTLRYEGLLLAETAGSIGTFAEVPGEVLLLGGDMKRPAFIRPTFDALARTLPHNRQVILPGLDHGGSADVGPTNRHGKPEVVAPAVKSFFTQP